MKISKYLIKKKKQNKTKRSRMPFKIKFEYHLPIINYEFAILLLASHFDLIISINLHNKANT